jgi:hypothetical protein
MIKKLLIGLFLLGSFFLHSQNLIWRTSMASAIEKSNELRKPMLILFTATGVAPNLQNEILKSPDFAAWSRDNVILVKLDLSDATASDSDKEQIVKLKNAFGVQELPEVCFASAFIRKSKTTFNALGKIAYKPGGVKAWIAESNAILHAND